MWYFVGAIMKHLYRIGCPFMEAMAYTTPIGGEVLAARYIPDPDRMDV
jgi:hypothetical protein